MDNTQLEEYLYTYVYIAYWWVVCMFAYPMYTNGKNFPPPEQEKSSTQKYICVWCVTIYIQCNLYYYCCIYY